MNAILPISDDYAQEFSILSQECMNALESSKIKAAQKRARLQAQKNETERLTKSGASELEISKAAGVSEGEIQENILKYLKANGVFCYRQNNQGRLRKTGATSWTLLPSLTPGIPDIGGVLPDGRALYIEVKRPGWKPPTERAMNTAHQRWLDGKAKKDIYDTHRAQQEFARMARKHRAVVIRAQSVSCVARALQKYCDDTWATFSFPNA